MDDKTIVCSFSGGETSAYMAIRLKEKYGDRVKFVFANTSQENEETLEFVDKVDKAYDLGVVWIEAVINPEKGKGTTYKITDFENAKRNGEVFEDMIKVYGLANPALPHCTRELKTVPIKKWARDNFKHYQMAIGIRNDELDRVNPNYKAEGLYYPLAFEFPVTKNQINRYWREQEFRLELKHWQGNCKTCFKKGFNKLAWIMKETPEAFEFIERMEKEHKFSGGRDTIPKEGAKVFRYGKTVADIREMSLIAVEPLDDARLYEVNDDLFGFGDLDACGSESCEAF